MSRMALFSLMRRSITCVLTWHGIPAVVTSLPMSPTGPPRMRMASLFGRGVERSFSQRERARFSSLPGVRALLLSLRPATVRYLEKKHQWLLLLTLRFWQIRPSSPSSRRNIRSRTGPSFSSCSRKLVPSEFVPAIRTARRSQTSKPKIRY